MTGSSRLSRGLGFIVLAIIMHSLAACSLWNGPSADIRIGVIAYTQGEDAIIEGASTVNAANMAVQEINSSGGLDLNGRKRKIVLVIEGIRSGPEPAVAATQKLINQENVSAIVGPQFSSDAIPAGEVAEKAHIPMISPISSNPQTTLGRQFVFRMGFVDDFQGKVMATFARQELKHNSAAVLYNIANPYSRDMANVFKQAFEGLGGQVVAFESYTSDENDFTAQLERIQSQAFQVLFLPNYSDESMAQAKQARQLGIEAVFLGSDSWEWRTFRTMSEFNNSFMSVNWSRNLDDEKSRLFVEKYVQQYNNQPGDTAALTYDAFGMLFQALRQQGLTEPEAIRQGLYDQAPYEGVSGTIDFTNNGDPIRSAVILQLKDGQDIVYRVIAP